jgi:hypothetical protein
MSDVLPPVSVRPRRRRSTSRRLVRIASSDPIIEAGQVREALQRALSSSDFPATERNRRFLAFVVEQTLAGESDKISGYAVATRVFGRPQDFNPTTDPIVRIEAAKLRRDLETYYLKSRAVDPVRIALPRGGYIPVFERAAATPSMTAVVLDPHGITLHTLHGNQTRLAQVQPPLQSRLADLLARQPDLAVFAGPARNGEGGLLDSDTARDLAQRNGTRFILSGEAYEQGDAVVFTARLHDGATGRLLWSENFVGEPSALDEVIARRVAEQQRALSPGLDGSVRSPIAA